MQIVETAFDRDHHAPAFLGLLESYAAELRAGAGLPDDVKRNLIAEMRARQGLHTFLSFVEGKPAGFAVSIESFSTFACKPVLNIHDVYVHQEFRGRGLSRRLLAETENLARRLGCCKLTLEVLENNAPAVRLYDALGYTGYELDPKLGRAIFLQKKLE